MKQLIFILIALILFGCSGHPTISPKPLRKGESYKALTFSAETGVPIYTYRLGLTNMTDIGIRFGLPLYGSGVDISRILTYTKNKYQMLNLSYTFSLNPNLEATYYNVKSQRMLTGLITYWGLRASYIPKGVSGGESTRVGILIGYYRQGSWGYELGYFHDFASMPLEEVFNIEPYEPSGGGYNLEHTSFNIPNERHRFTGLSFRINIPIGEKKVSIRKSTKKTP
ncbi:MAG: hypothetical protein ISR90_06585 [Candidatus Marinimicrobia bacterium]|nr:hypothetical protein [Candidatus Neomarinimicrobiota bacterium]MBL7023698.1 hypothetical protein [Candidatus Neomarinimicrobiota bacterium]MBL7110004.1 hypothetical protein [Candidatus Neomarinimicrobiota bacterium]